jgi:hypothetical protein
MEVRGTTATTSNYKTVGFQPENALLESGARFAHTIGEYYMWTIDVEALTDCTIELALEGYQSSGFDRTLDSTRVRLRLGQRKRIVLTGQYVADGDVPEVMPAAFLLKYDGTPGTNQQAIRVLDMFYRDSDSDQYIYPAVGYSTLRRP